MATIPFATPVSPGSVIVQTQQAMPMASLAQRLGQLEEELTNRNSPTSKAFEVAKAFHCQGVLMILVGIAGLFVSFAYITCALLITTGSLLVNAFNNVRAIKEMMARKFVPGDCCCHPLHLRNLGIALTVCSLISASYSISLTATWVPRFLSSKPTDCKSVWDGRQYVQQCTVYSGSGYKYLSLAFIGGIVLSALGIFFGLLLIWRMNIFEQNARMRLAAQGDASANGGNRPNVGFLGIGNMGMGIFQVATQGQGQQGMMVVTSAPSSPQPQQMQYYSNQPQQAMGMGYYPQPQMQMQQPQMQPQQPQGYYPQPSPYAPQMQPQMQPQPQMQMQHQVAYDGSNGGGSYGYPAVPMATPAPKSV